LSPAEFLTRKQIAVYSNQSKLISYDAHVATFYLFRLIVLYITIFYYSFFVDKKKERLNLSDSEVKLKAEYISVTRQVTIATNNIIRLYRIKTFLIFIHMCKIYITARIK